MSQITRRSVALATVAFVALPPLRASLAEGPRVVKNAVLQIITDDDGKDDADVFTVTIADANGKILERVFDAKEEIKPFTTFNIWLQKVRAATPEELKAGKITFRIDPKWDEHWVIKEARLTVNYESGPAEKWHWGPFVLQRKGAGSFEVEYPLTDEHRM